MQRIVRLWTHPGCPGGRRARRYFEAHQIPFEEVDSPVPAVATGSTGGVVVSPVIQVGDHTMRGFDAAEFNRLYHG
jgi:glutaredoxin